LRFNAITFRRAISCKFAAVKKPKVKMIYHNYVVVFVP